MDGGKGIKLKDEEEENVLIESTCQLVQKQFKSSMSHLSLFQRGLAHHQG